MSQDDFGRFRLVGQAADSICALLSSQSPQCAWLGGFPRASVRTAVAARSAGRSRLGGSSCGSATKGRGKAVETFGGKVFVRWDRDAEVTAFAPVAYFIEFLKANGLWQQWVKECPLNYRSGNAPPNLGTILLSVLAGHKRYAHVTTIRSDSVMPGLLGMERVRSEDAVRRAFLKGEAGEWV